MSEPVVRPVKLLLVADSPAQREALRQAFAVSPHLQILAEAQTSEALAYLTTPGTPRPDLVVIDLPPAVAGQSSGSFPLVEHLKNHEALQGLPLVLLADEGTLANLPESPGGCYCPLIRKPADPAALRKMAYHFGEYWGAVARLPLRPEESPARPPTPPQQPAVVPAEELAELPAQQFLEILVVDDNDDDATLFQESLSELEGVRVVQILDDADLALQFLRKQGPFSEARRPDLVVLDIHMPRKTGLKLLEEIQADDALRRLPVVMLTASRHEDDIRAAYSGGSCSFVEKPARYEWFRDLSARFANYWTLLAHLPPRQDE